MQYNVYSTYNTTGINFAAAPSYHQPPEDALWAMNGVMMKIAARPGPAQPPTTKGATAIVQGSPCVCVLCVWWWGFGQDVKIA